MACSNRRSSWKCSRSPVMKVRPQHRARWLSRSASDQSACTFIDSWESQRYVVRDIVKGIAFRLGARRVVQWGGMEVGKRRLASAPYSCTAIHASPWVEQLPESRSAK